MNFGAASLLLNDQNFACRVAFSAVPEYPVVYPAPTRVQSPQLLPSAQSIKMLGDRLRLREVLPPSLVGRLLRDLRKRCGALARAP